MEKSINERGVAKGRTLSKGRLTGERKKSTSLKRYTSSTADSRDRSSKTIKSAVIPAQKDFVLKLGLATRYLQSHFHNF